MAERSDGQPCYMMFWGQLRPIDITLTVRAIYVLERKSRERRMQCSYINMHVQCNLAFSILSEI